MFEVYQPGDLVEIVKAPDQGNHIRFLIGKLGIVIERAEVKSSPNIWKIFVIDNYYNIHALDIKLLKRIEQI